MNRITVAILVAAFAFSGTLLAEETTLNMASPDGNIRVEIVSADGALSYQVDFKGAEIIRRSPLGLSLKGGAFSEKLKVTGSSVSSHDSSWDMVWGQNATIRNNYNELVLDVEEDKESAKRMQLVFRAYNDGIAFRYLFPRQPGLDTVVFANENSTVAFVSDDPVAWHPLSSVMVSDAIRINQMKASKPSKKKKRKKPGKNSRDGGRTASALTPFTVKLSGNCYISLHEAAVEHASAGRVSLDSKAHTLRFSTQSTQPLPAVSAWRTVTIADSAAGLIESTMTLNLNEPSKLKDVSWIKPGKTLWDWRNHGALADDGFEYGLTTESYIRYIDFAAANNIEYVMVDAGWYGPERKKESDPTTYLPQIDIPKICQYAKSKGVAMWLYINTVALREYDLDKTLSRYHEWGVAGIKHGFLSGDTQAKIEFSHKVMRKCAEYKIMYVLHEPNKPTGLRRTWPHYMSREYVNSMLDAATRPSATPSRLCTFPFVHNLAGPVDRSCGMFDLDSYISREKCHRQLPSTVVSQCAQCLVFPSGLLTLPDHPDAYKRKIDLFEFISALPMTWDETRALNAEIGKLVTIARRSGNDWFVASLADEQGRTFELKLDFLEEGATYEATLYEDGEGADYHYIGPENKKQAAAQKVKLEPAKTKREIYNVRKATFRKGDVVNIVIAPGGGHCMILRKH